MDIPARLPHSVPGRDIPGRRPPALPREGGGAARDPGMAVVPAPAAGVPSHVSPPL